MNEVPILQSTMEQQGEIAKEVAQAVVDSVIIPWTEIKYRVRSIAPFLEDEVLTMERMAILFVDMRLIQLLILSVVYVS